MGTHDWIKYEYNNKTNYVKEFVRRDSLYFEICMWMRYFLQ